MFFSTRVDPKTSSSSVCFLKYNFFKFEEFVVGSASTGRAWQNVLLGLTSSPSQPFSPKISDQLANYLYCENQCNSQTAFGHDLPARNIQRGRDHGIPGTNIKDFSNGIFTSPFFSFAFQIYEYRGFKTSLSEGKNHFDQLLQIKNLFSG